MHSEIIENSRVHRMANLPICNEAAISIRSSFSASFSENLVHSGASDGTEK